MSDDSALEAAVDAAIAANPDVAEKVRGGKVQAAGALIGQVMKQMKGQADAAKVREILLAKLTVDLRLPVGWGLPGQARRLALAAADVRPPMSRSAGRRSSAWRWWASRDWVCALPLSRTAQDLAEDAAQGRRRPDGAGLV